MRPNDRDPNRPAAIEVRGARVHNLQNCSLDIPLHRLVGIAGVSGSGKSSLALGVLYAEGSRRYLESLSTYTRRRMTGAAAAAVDEVRYIPAALALHQRPAVPGIRSTFGTSTELLNSLRLMFSRLASHRCPACGAYQPPTLNVAAERRITCCQCGAAVTPPGAEALAFNSEGACPACSGTGETLRVDESTLVPDETKTIEEGAVAPWNSLMWSLMVDVCRAMGVRTNVPFCELTAAERAIVFHGPAEKKHIFYHPKEGNDAAELDFTYYNAVYTVENALKKVKDEAGMKRVEKFLRRQPCEACGGTRLSDAARAPRLCGISLDRACAMTLRELVAWVAAMPETLPEAMRPMARAIGEAFLTTARRLTDLGLSYLTLDRASATLSTGERQRAQLARAVRNRTTGVLYVLDEPSIGLHPCNLEGLAGVLHDLLADGNSVVLVDHDVDLLRRADYLIELGPGAGADGGRVIATGSVEQLCGNPASLIGPYLRPGASEQVRPPVDEAALFAAGQVRLQTGPLHTVQPLTVAIPKGRLTAVTGVSGSGKTTLVLESLLPALRSAASGAPLPAHVRAVDPAGIRQVKLIDATPIGINVRSTVATYAGVHDELRRCFAKTAGAKAAGYKAGDFSYNTGRLRCPVCDGTGCVSLDVQFLPDVEIPCPACKGSRYAPEAFSVTRPCPGGEACSLPALMAMSVTEALPLCDDLPAVRRRLQLLQAVGLGYLTLGEQTPGLSGGEAQRLKLTGELTRGQSNTLFIFDEPTIGLHPLDVRTLLHVLQTLVEQGATVVVIEHDLTLIRNADYVIDLGPGGGAEGGRLVAAGPPAAIAANPASLTGRYL